MIPLSTMIEQGRIDSYATIAEEIRAMGPMQAGPNEIRVNALRRKFEPK
jgi:hypothetical protein